MVVSRCICIGPPSPGIVLGTLFLLASEVRRHPTSASLAPAESKIDYADLRRLYCLILLLLLEEVVWHTRGEQAVATALP